MLILEDVIMPPILFYVKSKEEAITDIRTVSVDCATWCACRNLVGTHLLHIPNKTLKIVLKKRMKNALTRVSRAKMTILLVYP